MTIKRTRRNIDEMEAYRIACAKNGIELSGKGIAENDNAMNTFEYLDVGYDVKPYKLGMEKWNSALENIKYMNHIMSYQKQVHDFFHHSRIRDIISIQVKNLHEKEDITSKKKSGQ